MPVTTRRQQLTTILNQFYAQPIARVSFELLISVSVILFFAMFAIRPTLLTMSDLIKEIDDKRTLDKALSQKIAALGSAQSEYLTLQNRIEILDEAIPSRPALVDGLKVLEKIASDRGLAITALSVSDIPNEPTELPTFSRSERKSLIVTMTISGDYPTIRQFVEDLRNSRRMFIVESVTFSTGDEQGKRVLRSSLSINMPYFGLKAAGDPKTPSSSTGGGK
jgi:Tfp pilus assembly protein PilO